jgi:hypothetical protein
VVPSVRGRGGAQGGAARAAAGLATTIDPEAGAAMMQPAPRVTTRFVVELEDMNDEEAGGFALWLQMLIQEQTDHQIARLLYQRSVPWNPNELSGR